MKRLLPIVMFSLACLGYPQVKAYAPEAQVQPKAKVSVKVRPLTEVAGPRVTLGDIADVTAPAELKAKLEQIDFGTAPVAGIPRPVVASRIQSLLIVAGLKLRDVELQVPADARIALKVQKVELAKFVEAAKQAVTPLVGPQVLLTNNQTFPDFIAPTGELVLEASKPSKGQSGYTVLVSVLVDGKKINSRLINLGIDASTAAAIKSGDAVRIYIKSAGATIEVSGRARTAGFAGQQITVVSSTGSIHQGTVLSASEVEVKL